MMNTDTINTSTMNRGVFSWCLYDWANSAYITVIVTFVFATYFTKGIAPDEVTGTALWGNAMGLSAIIVALLAPIIGAIADRMGRRKPWLFLFTILSIGATGLLWYALPNEAYVAWALTCVIIATIGFEFGMVFYNAMLPEIVGREHIGRVSGWAWGVGFFGGLAALLLCLFGFVQTVSTQFRPRFQFWSSSFVPNCPNCPESFLFQGLASLEVFRKKTPSPYGRECPFGGNSPRSRVLWVLNSSFPVTKQEVSMGKINQPILLSLDLGIATGWALSNKHGRIMSGTAHFRPRRFEGGGMRYLRFERWLNETHDVSGEINAVYFEEVRRHLGVDAAHAYGGFFSRSGQCACGRVGCQKR